MRGNTTNKFLADQPTSIQRISTPMSLTTRCGPQACLSLPLSPIPLESPPFRQASKLTVTHSSSETPLPPSSSLVFGQTFSSHMLTASWSIKSGWGTPEIKPYGPLALDPSSTVLHYAQTLVRRIFPLFIQFKTTKWIGTELAVS